MATTVPFCVVPQVGQLAGVLQLTRSAERAANPNPVCKVIE
jgi:hypothetical protein